KGSLRSEEYLLGYSLAGKHVLDIDEFCLFDRALTDDEVAALAGRAKLPSAQVPPQPVTVAPLPHAAPPRLPARPAESPGLTCNRDCEEYDGQTVLDRVSKNLVGQAHHQRLVEDGPRGKALRITSAPADGTQKHPPALSLPPELLKVGAG